MSRASPRLLSAAVLALMVTPSVFLGLTAASVADPGGHGAFVVGDPAGDAINARGTPAVDITRLGAYDDGSNAWFVVKVNSVGTPPAPSDTLQIAVNFTTPDGTKWLARGIYEKSGVVDSSGVFERDANIGHTTDSGAGAVWHGNELVIHVPNSDMAPNYVPKAGDVWTGIDAWTGNWGSATDAPGSQQYFDSTDTSTYTIGTATATTQTGGGAPTVPAAPVNLGALAGNGHVTLTWAPPMDNGGAIITSYSIYRGTSSGGENLLTTTATAVLSFTDSGLTNGVTYYYEVAATNSVGTGAPSNEASAVPQVATAAAVGFTLYQGPSGMVDKTGEGSIGVDWKTGNVMFGGNTFTCCPGQRTARVQFDDSHVPATATWTDVTSPTATTNIDPILFTDRTTGRTFAGGDGGYCGSYRFTDDDGATWLPVTNDCTTVIDHPTVGGGPFHNPLLATPVYSHSVYMCQDSISLVGVPTLPAQGDCTVSYDGGITWQPESPLPCGDLMGHLRVGPDGVAYIPNKDCVPQESDPVVVRSMDDGLTWTAIHVTGTASPPRADSSDPSIAAGRGDKFPGGRLYYAIQDASGKMLVSTSTDDGSTWTAPSDISTPQGVKTTTFPEVIAGDDDRAAVEWLGTKDAGNAFANGFTGIWHAYMSVTYDGGVTWSTVDLTPNDPVQRGPICLAGGGCTGGRNLLDFNDITMDAHGRILGEYADGCLPTNGCSAPSGTVDLSTSSWGTIARQSSGNTLLSAYDTVTGPLTAMVTGPYNGKTGQPVAVTGVASGGAAPYSFAWTVTSSPPGSSGGSFASAASASTTFTPDVAGTYSLLLTVHDAGGAMVTATTTLAAADLVIGCQSGGTVLATDAGNDGGTAGPASEVFCVRGTSSSTSIDLYIDTKGTQVNGSKISASSPLYYDLYFADAAQGGDKVPPTTPAPGPVIGTQPYDIETTWDGSTLATKFLNAQSLLAMPGRTVTAAWEGSTIHLSWSRSDPAAPADGDSLVSMYLDVNHVEGATGTGGTGGTTAHDDYVPDSGYMTDVIAPATSAGHYYPACGERLGTDPAGDSKGPTAPTAEPTSDSHDLTAFSASDDGTTMTICWTVVNITNTTPTEESLTAFWSAPYQGKGIAYSVNVAINADGTVDQANSQAAKGACDPAGAVGCGTVLAITPVGYSVHGNTVSITLAKSDLGNPTDGAVTGTFSVDSRDRTDSNGVSPYDQMTGSAFTFGRKVTDDTPPSQVTGLAVSDPKTGSSLTLTWNAATDDVGVTQYNVYRGTTAIAHLSGTAFTDTGLTADTQYSYHVNAQDAAGNVGPDSATVNGTPTRPVDTTPPSVPANLAACGTTTSTICISWSASADPESGVKDYVVYRNGSRLATTTTTTFKDLQLAASTTYTYAVAAENNANIASAPSSDLAVTTVGFGTPNVAITSPANGTTLAGPMTFTGTYTTNGQPASPHGAQPASQALPWATKDWLQSQFVGTNLRSLEFSQLQAQLATLSGFVAAVPTADGKINVFLSGKTPTGAPTASKSGWPIVYAEDVHPKILHEQAAARPTRLLTLADVQGNAPTGPVMPGVQQGIGPGDAFQVHDPVNGGSYVCTASYLFENPTTGQYFLETAGHCLLDATTTTDSAAQPSGKVDEVDLCIANCQNNYIGLGTYVALKRTATYDPVAYAHQSGIGQDVGFIAIPKELNQYLRPWMWMWSGPTQAPTTAPALGDMEVHYGHGVASGAVFPEQGRVAVSLGSDVGNLIQGSGAGSDFLVQAGFIYGGDSGSAIGAGSIDQNRLVSGGAALGIITHELGRSVCTPAVQGIGVCVDTPGNIFFATAYDHALDMVQSHLGFRPKLVTQDATIRAAGAGPSLAATIDTPVDGSTFAVGNDITASGTATFPTTVTSGTGGLTYYAAQDTGGTSCPQNPRLELAPPATQAACEYTFSPGGPVFDAVGGIAGAYSSGALPNAVPLDPSRPIQAWVWVKTAAVNAYTDIEVQVLDGSTLVGSQRLTSTASSPTGAPVNMSFSFPALVKQIPAGDAVTMKIIVHEAQEGGQSVGGSTPTGFTLPLGAFATSTVDLSVDDATFGASHAVATSVGASSWSATIPTVLLDTGAHTIYVRATQGAAHSAVQSVSITEAGTRHTPPVAAFTQSRDRLAGTFTDASTAGDGAIATWAWDFGDGQTGAGASVTHVYAADGTYTVKLTVTDANGLVSSATHDITVAADGVWALDIGIVNGTGVQWLPTHDLGRVATGTGSWSYFWNVTPAPDAYTTTVRLLRDDAPVKNATSVVIVPQANRAPVMAPIAAQTVQQASALTFTLSATDPDNDPLTWSLVSGPAGLAFDASTHVATWTPTFDQLGAYSATFAVTDGQLTATQVVPITVLLTPRSPSVDNATGTLVERHAGSIKVHASSLNHDVPTLAASNLPQGATFTDLGNGDGRIDWTPGLATAGAYTATVQATSYGLTGTGTVALTVLQDSAFTMKFATPVGVQTSPDVNFTLAANVTNTGPEADSFSFATNEPSGWTIVSAPGAVSLQPGETATVSVTLHSPADALAATPRLTATATGNPNVQHALTWSVSAPLVVKVAVDTTTVGKDVTGNVTVTWFDGAPVTGARVLLTQTPQLSGVNTIDSQASTSQLGATNATGKMGFDLAAQQAMLPGTHAVVVRVGYNGRAASVTTTYTIGP